MGKGAEILDIETKKNIEKWLKGNYDEETKAEIRRLLKEAPQKLIESFYTSLSFGTGGLRAIMGIGPNRMNIYTLATIIQGFANYIKTYPKVDNAEHKILIGYDSRNNSRLFAEEAAKILAASGIKTYLFKQMCTTPLLSYGCRQKKCNGAIMITASHNPPEYNGIKIYWADGAQVLFPHDKGILDEIKKVTEKQETIATPMDLNNPNIVEIGSEVDSAYIEMSSHLQSYREENQLYGNELKIVYTSLHGTGITIAPKVFERWGFTNLHYVDDQIKPDGYFSTVTKPNPEEPKALSMGIDKLQKIRADILLATDPDADRVGVVIRHNNFAHIISGNQIASLLLSHICKALTEKNKMPANAAFIKTIVTTELFAKIVSYYQKPCFNVLPGFKYIAEKIRQWENEPRGNQFVFAAEDSCGYLYGRHVRDKDAITTSALIAEMALQAKLKGQTLIDLLEEIYKIHGLYHEELACVPFEETKEGRAKMMRGLQLLKRSMPREIGGIEVASIEDFERSIKVDLKLHQSEPLQLPKSNMLLFWLADGSKLVIRPSGTEPKVKIYCGVTAPYSSPLSTAVKAAQIKALNLIEILTQMLKDEI